VSVAVAVLYGIVQQATRSHREVSLEQRRAQVRWVLESAVDRAAAHLSIEGGYVGERWSIPSEELGGRYDAEVLVQVDPVEGQGAYRQVRIVADYPVDPAQRVRQTREFRMRVRPQVRR
jgi:hypothetical protein